MDKSKIAMAGLTWYNNSHPDPARDIGRFRFGAWELFREPEYAEAL